MSFFIFETDRNKMNPFKSATQFQKTIRVYMYKFKDEFYNKNTHGKELNATGKVFKFLYSKSFNEKENMFGLSYWSNKKIAQQTGLCVRSVRRATTNLTKLSIISKIHTKRKNGSNTTNTYVILPLLPSIVDKVFKIWETPCPHTKSSLEKSSFKNVLKQERENNISNPTYEKIVEYVIYRVNDAIKKGTTIKYLSAYIDRTFRSIQRQALYYENRKQSEQRRQFEKQMGKEISSTLGLERNSILFLPDIFDK